MSGPTSRILRHLRVATVALAVALIGVLGWLEFTRRDAPAVVISGTADVGGAFDLVDQGGRRVTADTLLGRPFVVYFGWSHDPDLTPAALQVLAAALQHPRLGAEALRAVFITIDAERDTPARLAAYAHRIDERLVALTGSAEELARVARAYKHYAKRLPDAALPGGFGFDHASLYYVIGADGAFRGVVPHTTDAQALAGELLRLGH